MFKKGDIETIEIVDQSARGQGIGRADGLAVFVADTVVGDVVEVEITKMKKSYAFARRIRLVSPSDLRIDAVCPYAGQCGGCSLATTSYPGQLAIKERQVYDKLERIGGLSSPKVRPIEALTDDPAGPAAYRNKAVLSISTGGNRKVKGGIIENLGPVRVGFMRSGSHQVVDCDYCMLQTPAVMAAARAMRSFMNEDNITAWDPKWRQGLMHSMTVRTAFGTGEVMVILTINGRGIPNGEKLVGMLADAIDEAGAQLTSVVLECLRGDDRASAEFITLAGRRVIRDRLGGLDLEVFPGSFYQVDPAMTVKMYDKMKEYAALTGSEKVLDLYCGAGSIGLWCAGEAAFVLGIESQHQAILDANRNAVINGIVNARYICGKAEDVLPDLLKDGAGEQDADLAEAAAEADVVILDPPRAGCHPALLDAVILAAPERIVYMSCDPATLARDIKTLCEAVYRFVEATPFDNFPWTSSVETVALLSRT
ncbi:MAG: 23S rRNA (uracil(1939)-C(5))-methyltransferase RlmD [Anaerovoracaceae bacterium]|jgi:23S rRNA (uracil1939-C5)-methyltransferase